MITNKLKLFIVLTFLSFAMVLHISAQQISVFVNNTAIEPAIAPYIENDRVLAPIRAIFEALNAKVHWHAETQTVECEKNEISVVLQIGNDLATVNGKAVRLDTPARLAGGSTMVPLRFIAESLNCFVGWQEATHTVFISDAAMRKELSVHFIDVGQGDCILILLPNNKNMLIDAGNYKDRKLIVDYIKGQNIDRLDYIVATHPHADHIGGMAEVIKTFNIGMVYMPKAAHTSKTYEDTLNAIKEKGVSINSAKEGVVLLNDNGLQAEIIAPVSDNYSSLNNYSAVIRLVYLNKTFLLMGDAEKKSEEEIKANVKANVIKIGHHGSDTSTAPSFLSKVLPEYAVISVGADNSYKHPSDATLNILADYGVSVYRTDINGTIIAITDGNSLEICCQKEGNKTESYN